MKIGLVGSEASKFTRKMEATAKAMLMTCVSVGPPIDTVVSGECHLGGIDIWAKEMAMACGMPYIGCPPAKLTWEGGYKQRNLKIVRESDSVICITVKDYHKGYTGMRFPYCYHCGNRYPPHVKSGGCWTMWKAHDLGKGHNLFILDVMEDD